MGYSPRAEIFDVTSSIPTIVLQLRDWKKAREDAQKLIIKAQKKWTKGKTPAQKYKIGDQVWLEGRNLRVDRPSAKLTPKRHGPFKIKRVLSPIVYQLELPSQWKIHDVFHVDLLTPYRETKLHGPNFTRPPPDLINEKRNMKLKKSFNHANKVEGARCNTWSSGKGTQTWRISGLIGKTCMPMKH